MFDLCAWRRFDARTLDAPSEVKANALTGWYNGKRAASNDSEGRFKGSTKSAAGRNVGYDIPVIVATAKKQYEPKGAGVGNSRRDIPRCRACSFRRTEVLAGLEPIGRKRSGSPTGEKSPKSSVSESVFFIFRGDLFLCQCVSFGGGFCREATREVLGEHGPQAARSPPAAQRQNRPKSGVLQAMAIVTKLLRAKHQTTTEPLLTARKGVRIP